MERPQFPLPIADKHVSIGMPCNSPMSPKTVMSLLRTVTACHEAGVKLEVDFITGCSDVTTARNRVLDSFLKGPADRLFWIDSDMTWSPDSFLRVLALTTEMDIVGGVYPMKTNEVVIPVAFAQRNQFDMNKYGLLSANGLGLGFVCMTRKVVEAVAVTKPTVVDRNSGAEFADVFRRDTFKGYVRGEDMAFFADARELGFNIWIDPTIKLGHVGEKEYKNDPVKYLGLEKHYAASAE